MLYSRLRFAMIFFFLSLGAILHLRLGIQAAWYLYLASGLLLVMYFLFGNVWAAFNLLKRGRPEASEAVLDRIYFPEWLLPRNKAYYHFTRGMIFLQRKEIEPAEYHLSRAARLGLSRPTDQALLLLNLAHIEYLRQRYEPSRALLDRARSQPTDDLMIRDHIEKLEKALASGRKNTPPDWN